MNSPTAVNPSEPKPVVPLSYFERGGAALPPAVRLLALAAMVDGAILAGVFFLQTGFVLWEALSPRSASTAYFTLSSWQWVLSLPGAIAGTVFCIGGFLAMKLRPAARRTLVVGAMLVIICTIATWASSALFLSSRSSGLPPSFRVYQLANNVMYAVRHCVLPAVVWLIFRQPAVREIFATCAADNDR
ncbi:MAG TPA: hypothetical protein VLI90_08970 [Tepidisphaeraceae bacterium]|nr:hypothetical protein [Tepidisphaeraceae bacterium]